MKVLIPLFLLICSSSYGQGTYQNSGTQVNLNSLEVINDQIIYVGGDNGVLLKTVNGGNTWNTLNTFSSLDIVMLSFVSVDTGFICVKSSPSAINPTSAIYRTVDAGITFDSLTLAASHVPLYLHFIDGSVGFYSCSDGVFKTTDSGQSWTQVNQETLSVIYFPSDQIGYGVNPARQLVKSSNAGDDWTVVGNLSTGEFYSDITFPSVDTGFVCSSYYGAYGSTTNGGQTLSGGNLGAHSMHFPSNNTGYYLHHDGIADSTLIGYTFDNGQNWNTLLIDSARLDLIRFANNTTGWAVGDNGVIMKIEQLALHVMENVSASDIKVFPNPASEYLHVEIKIKHKLLGLKLFNILGELVKKSNTKSMFIKDLPKGPYFLEITTTEGITKKQILKQ
jgi:photosystem II stability/assembly factor-like uncharacterized protein